jgi:hypothetical protein
MPFLRFNHSQTANKQVELIRCPPAAFHRPWSVEQQEARFVVKDRDGQKLAYVYFEDEPGRTGWRTVIEELLNERGTPLQLPQ